MKPAFHPSHTPWKSLRGFPHYHSYGDDYDVSEDRQSPPKTLNQSHSHRKGLVNRVPGLKRKGCPGTLTLALLLLLVCRIQVCGLLSDRLSFSAGANAANSSRPK
jgi:hypothetical protein